MRLYVLILQTICFGTQVSSGAWMSMPLKTLTEFEVSQDSSNTTAAPSGSIHNENPHLVLAQVYAQAAANGDARAKNYLGKMCEQGHLNGTKFVPNPEEKNKIAAEYFLQAANADFFGAWNALARMLMDGRLDGRPYRQKGEDPYTAAARCFAKAALAGCEVAIYNLGKMCEQGHLSDEQTELAVKLLRTVGQESEYFNYVQALLRSIVIDSTAIGNM